MKLHQMTWEDVEKQMSIAGSPAKIKHIGEQLEGILFPALDATNRAELTNVELMLKRLAAEIRWLQRRYDKNH